MEDYHPALLQDDKALLLASVRCSVNEAERFDYFLQYVCQRLMEHKYYALSKLYKDGGSIEILFGSRKKEFFIARSENKWKFETTLFDTAPALTRDYIELSDFIVEFIDMKMSKMKCVIM